MTSMLIVLFFALTGLTLNHPTWTLGQDPVTTHVTGTLPATYKTDGQVDFLAVSEYVRSTDDVGGTITDHAITGDQGTISYRGAGYAADLLFSTTDGSYQLNVTKYGVVAALNDLHKGRDTGAVWSWVIDVSAVVLAVVALTGVLLQVFIKRRRWVAFTLLGVGAAAAIALTLFTV